MFKEHFIKKPTHSNSRLRLIFCAFTSLFLAACSWLPKADEDSATRAAVATQTAIYVQRIADLERQLAEQQRLMSDRQRQMSERRRSWLEEKRQLERQLKDSQTHLDELQKKLEAIVTIDRDLRPGFKER
jgi:septal ring factor EnvC (AmiA/AmiB activator)